MRGGASRKSLKCGESSGRGAARVAIEAMEPRSMLAVDVSLDLSQRHQTIDGFGSAMAWWVNSPYELSAFREMYYRDLGSSMLRMDLVPGALVGPGGTLDSPVALGPDLEENIAKFNFNVQGAANLGAFAQAGLLSRLDDFKLIGSLWTPPHWMKGPELNPYNGQVTTTLPTLTYNGSNSSGGSLIDTPANLEQFGRYVAAWVVGFERRYGVEFDAISIQNELVFHEPYNSAVYTPALYVKALKAVDAAFTLYGIDTKIQGPEDVGVGSTSDPWILWRQFNYINAVRADPVARQALDIYSIHGYASDGAGSNRSPDLWNQYWNGRTSSSHPTPAGAWWTGIKNDGKKSWMTETSGEPHTWAGAMTVASNALDALVQGNVSAWVYWQTADGGAANTATLTSGTDTSSKKYNAAKHVFRYVRPGAVRVTATPTSPAGVYVAAFDHDANNTLTMVLQNTTTTSQTVNLNVAGSGLTRFGVHRRTSATETWSDQGAASVNNGVATITLPASSIVTLHGAPPPTATSRVFEFQTGQRALFTFSHDIGTSLSTADLQLSNLSNPGVTASARLVGYDPATRRATIDFPGGELPDGNWRLRITAGSISDTWGTASTADATLDFFVLAGDIDRDRAVGFSDLVILAQNYGVASGATWGTGDLDRDGAVSFADLVLLAQNYGTSQPTSILRATDPDRPARVARDVLA